MPLNTGDIAFVGWNSDGNDNLAFVTLAQIDADSQIHFNDNEWSGLGFTTGESVFTWTANSTIAAGTVITINNIGTGVISTNLGTVAFVGIPTRALAGTTEVVYAYIGTPSTPTTFLTAIANNTLSGSGAGDITATLTGTGLTVGVNAIELITVDADADVAAYNGARTGVANFSDYLALINDPTNWTTQDGSGDQSADGTTPDIPFNSTGFTIGDSTPSVNLTVSSNAGTEAGQTVITVAAITSSAVSSDQTINLTVTGSGIAIGDYTLSNSVITILSGQTTGSVTFTIVNDVVVEGVETATLTISNPSAGITLGSTTSQNINITDDDTASTILNVGSITFDASLEATNTHAMAGSTSSNAGLAPNNSIYAAYGTDLNHSTYAQLGGAAGESTQLAPDGATRGGIQVNWGSQRLIDQPGIDFVISENGGFGAPEYYVVRVKPVGTDPITNFVYKPAHEYLDSGSGTGEFFTAFDLVGDFGLAPGAMVEFVEIWNMLTTDTFDVGGVGFLGGGVAPQKSTLDTSPGMMISAARYDADIPYIWAATNSNLVTDSTAPTIVSIVRADADPTSATSVNYTVTFSEAVTGVDATDFMLASTGGITTPSITAIAGTGTTRTITVDTGTGNGTIRLDVNDNDSITDGASNSLGGTGFNNGDFTTGETYTINRNNPPVATHDDAGTPEDTAFDIYVLVNDSDADGHSLQITAVSNPANGVAVVNDNGTPGNTVDDYIVYTPNANFHGSDNFTYTIADGNGGTAIATVNVTVNTVSEPAMIGGTSTGNVTEDGILTTTGALFITDPDAGEANIISQTNQAGTYGSFSIDPTGVWVYTAVNNRLQSLAAGQTVTDRFEISSQDGTPATIAIAIQGVNDAPNLATSIADQVAQTRQPFTLTLPPGVFTDVDAGDRLTLNATLADGSPLPAWLSFNANTRSFSGTPDITDAGNLSLKVTATDNQGASVSDTFVLTVEPLTEPLGTPTTPILFSQTRSGVTYAGTPHTDTLLGSWKNDVLRGRGGNDILKSGFAKALFGQDKLYGEGGNDQLYGGKGKDMLDGGQGSDRLYGGDGRDLLRGGDGRDQLFGHAGNDLLVGGQGADTLTGGSGRDMFVYDRVTEGVDLITDFNGQNDVIDLRGIFKAPEFRRSNPFAQYQQFVELVSVGRNMEVRIDADGNGSSTVKVTLMTLKNITSAEINTTHFVV
ncbi:cadherin-like domain-containing protein [Oscillatoria sp. FACHB-1407]|uniref:VCBS domain-containing protein n=1 Tax=Oscillatoria sp. FACHB-1407 TaxID=2692847 RepID=UPI0016864C35|nr:VCBS domain-containing protein [Oscillatoria sp. FACHB-1407]MBD2463127.1 cadherin-like domain-containing protein [Oscillatoria sp. FACHB-1407]